MNFVSRLLVGWGDLFYMPQSYLDKYSSLESPMNYTWMGTIFNAISIVLWVVMGLVGAAGAIYAIYLGIQLARAEDQSKRDEAKKHLITVLIAVAVTIVLVLFFNLILPEIVKAFMGAKNIYYLDPKAYPPDANGNPTGIPASDTFLSNPTLPK